MLNLSDDVAIGAVLRAVVREREQRLDHVRIRVLVGHAVAVAVAAEHDHRPRLAMVDELEVCPHDRVSGTADDARIAHVGHPLANRVLHLRLGLLGEDHDAWPPAALVGHGELRQDAKDPR